MITSANAILCGGFFVIIFLVDSIIGSGIIDSLKFLVSRFFVSAKDNVNVIDENELSDYMSNKIAFGVGLELVVLSLSMLILHNLKRFRAHDRFDELLNESKTALRQANEVLEKWQNRSVPSVYSYLDTESQDQSPVKVEVPVLHMAIVDTVTRNRDQQERGDAVDTISIVDSTLLSLTSLIDHDDDGVNETTEARGYYDPNYHAEGREGKSIDSNDTNFNFSRHLWDVEEEDLDGILK